MNHGCIKCDRINTNNKNWQEPTYGASQLYLAAERGSEYCVQYLLTCLGANPNVRTFIGWTALHIASQEGHDGCVTLLAAGNADLDLPLDNSNGSTAVILACKNGHVNVLLALLDAGADLHKTNAFGQSPAHIASQFGHVKCLLIIIARGGKYTLPDNQGVTPIDLAIIFEQPECVGVLLARHAEWTTEFHFDYCLQQV